MTERFVLDCSVAVKWYLLDEEDVDLAQLIHLGLIEETLELHAPELLKYEVAHALSKASRIRKPRLSKMETEHLDCPWLTAELQFQGPFPLGFPQNRIQILNSIRMKESP